VEGELAWEDELEDARFLNIFILRCLVAPFHRGYQSSGNPILWWMESLCNGTSRNVSNAFSRACLLNLVFPCEFAFHACELRVHCYRRRCLLGSTLSLDHWNFDFIKNSRITLGPAENGMAFDSAKAVIPGLLNHLYASLNQGNPRSARDAVTSTRKQHEHTRLYLQALRLSCALR